MNYELKKGQGSEAEQRGGGSMNGCLYDSIGS